MNDDRHRRLAELLPSYALGALEGDERAEVEEHLEACAQCAAELAAWRGTTERLADATPAVAPSPNARARVLAAVAPGAAAAAGEPGPRPATRDAPAPSAAGLARPQPPARPPPVRAMPSASFRRRSPAAWLAAAAVLAALVLAGWSLVRQGTLVDDLRRAGDERQRLLAEQDALRDELAAERARGTELSATLELVGSPRTQRIALAGLGSGAGAAGTAFVDPERGAARFTARDLPRLPADRTYQLWYITADGGPVSAGVFGVDERGRAVIEVTEVPAPEQVQVWAVTVEPAGGVPAPTGEMVLKS